MQTIKLYNNDVTNYTKCLEFEAKQRRISSDEQTRRHNAAIDGLQATASKFNEQVRLFNAQNGTGDKPSKPVTLLQDRR